MYELHGQQKTQHYPEDERTRSVYVWVRALNSKVKSLTVCHSAKFKLVIASAKKANGFDASKKASATPSLACKLGYTLKKACEITVVESLMNDNAETGQKAKNLIILLESDWKTYVSKHARKNLEQRKWNKPNVLSLTEDIVKMHNHLKNVENKSREELAKSPNAIAWRTLAESVLYEKTFFNEGWGGGGQQNC